MNNKIKVALMFMISAFSILIGATDVFAATLNREPVENVYWTRRGGGQDYMSGIYEKYSMDGKTVYCIEPGTPITTQLYNGQVGWVNSPYSEEVNRKIQLIGYYGYEYPGHNTLRYRMATQALVWETVGGQIIEWWTEASGYGDNINVDFEKGEIMKLVNAHYEVPSFNGQSKTGIINQPITFEDSKNVLSNYEVISNNDIAKISGNTLTITPNKVGNMTISLKRKTYTNDPTTKFVEMDDKSQKMGYFGIDDPVVSQVSINVLGGRVEITKKDKETGLVKPQGMASLSNAEYGIYDTDNDTLVGRITTDNNAFARSDYLPKLGRFYLKELKASTGYQINPQKYYFTIDENNLLVKVDVDEEVIKRDFEFTKVYASDKTQLMTPEVNVRFAIYDHNNNLVSIETTDYEGKIYITLPYGEYTLRQLDSPSGYELLEDYHFEVKDMGPTINKVFSNAEITARIKVIKVDQDGNVITRAGIKFKIKDLSTGKYVCQTVAYPNQKTYCEFETDENGVLITPYPLNSGSYQLEEVDQVIDGYVWNSTPLTFTIDENSDIISTDEFDAIIELRFSNQEVKGVIEIQKTGEKVVIEDGKFTYVEIPLPNVVFGLYDESGNLVGKYTTDENGFIRIEDLKLGKYTLKELETADGFVLNEEVFDIELKYKDQYTPIVKKTFELKNYLEKGNLEFTKKDLTSGKEIPNVKVEVYTENDELIFSGITDENGKIVIENLFVGKFYIIETEAATGYRLSDEKVYFEIKENGEVVKAEMTNEKFKGSLDFTKESFAGEALPNTLIEIYNAETDELVFSGRTDENGKIVIEELEYGKYYILEKEAPEGYLLNEERMYFEILEDGQVVKSVMKDEKIEMPKTFNTELISTITIVGTALLGLGLLIYGKKKNK